MNILTNWVFWIIIAAIVFVLAIIGYLSESKKKDNKTKEVNNDFSNDTASSNVDNVSTLTNEVQSVVNSPSVASDFNVMPEINSTTVSQTANAVSNSSLDSSVFNIPSKVESAVSQSVEQVPVAETPATNHMEQASVVDTLSTIEPASVFKANLEQEVPSTPTPIPADSMPTITPTPIPSVPNTEVKLENQSNDVDETIETL